MVSHRIICTDHKKHEYIDIFDIKTFLTTRECSIRFRYAEIEQLDILDGDEMAYGEYNKYSAEEVEQLWPMEVFWIKHFCDLYFGGIMDGKQITEEMIA